MITPGKYEGCRNQKLAEKLHAMTLDGCDEELGSVEDYGWFGLLLDIDDKSYIVNEDNYGFFEYTEYDSIKQATGAWESIAKDYASECENIID